MPNLVLFLPGVGAPGETPEASADGSLSTGRAFGVAAASGVGAWVESAAEVGVASVLRGALADGLVALSFTDGVLTARVSGAGVPHAVGVRVT